jgi:hypothetical protein
MGGMWPFLALIIDTSRAIEIVNSTLMNPGIFLTDPMPLPFVAKDEPGYNPKGEYWVGSTWINISLVAIKGLELYGFDREAQDLIVRTLNGIANSYFNWKEFPNTLWEAYAPEYPAPASHKVRYPDKLGTVRNDFGGWTCCLINLIIEDYMGIAVNAPENMITWKLKLNEDHGVRNLKFKDTITDLICHLHDNKIILDVTSNMKYKLRVIENKGIIKEFNIKTGDNSLTL